jgi:hypothetical protein
MLDSGAIWLLVLGLMDKPTDGDTSAPLSGTAASLGPLPLSSLVLVLLGLGLELTVVVAALPSFKSMTGAALTSEASRGSKTEIPPNDPKAAWSGPQEPLLFLKEEGEEDG